MKHVTFTVTLCVAALAAAYSTACMAEERVMAVPAAAARWTFDGGIHDNVFTRDGAFVYVLNENSSVAKVDRASQCIVGTLAAPARSL